MDGVVGARGELDEGGRGWSEEGLGRGASQVASLGMGQNRGRGGLTRDLTRGRQCRMTAHARCVRPQSASRMMFSRETDMSLDLSRERRGKRTPSSYHGRRCGCS